MILNNIFLSIRIEVEEQIDEHFGYESPYYFNENQNHAFNSVNSAHYQIHNLAPFTTSHQQTRHQHQMTSSQTFYSLPSTSCNDLSNNNNNNNYINNNNNQFAILNGLVFNI